jgi:diphthamide synthase subunit DPH2
LEFACEEAVPALREKLASKPALALIAGITHRQVELSDYLAGLVGIFISLFAGTHYGASTVQLDHRPDVRAVPVFFHVISP